MKLTEQIIDLLEIQSPLTLKEITDHFITIGYEPPYKTPIGLMITQALVHLTRSRTVQREVNHAGVNHYFLDRRQTA